MAPPGQDTRKHVSSAHARAQALVAQLVEDTLQTGRKVGHRKLRVRLAVVRRAIEDAIDVEERELIPLLRAVDAWGSVRVDRVRERHACVLSAIDQFAHDVAVDCDGQSDLVLRAEELVAALKDDLEEESQALSASEQAQDGTVVIDQESE